MQRTQLLGNKNGMKGTLVHEFFLEFKSHLELNNNTQEIFGLKYEHRVSTEITESRVEDVPPLIIRLLLLGRGV